MADDSSCDSGDPDYYIWRHGTPPSSDEDLIEDEMLDYCIADNHHSTLREFVDGLRKDRRKLRSELRMTQRSDREKASSLDYIKGELAAANKEKNKANSEKFNSFVYGLLTGIVLSVYFMYF